MEHYDDELRRALDALDVRQMPAAEPGWEERVLETLQRASRVQRPLRRARLRLLFAACLALAALLVFFGSGAAAKVGIPNPIDFILGRSSHPHGNPHPQVSPSTSPTTTPVSPSPQETHSATPRPSPKPSPSLPVPAAWAGEGATANGLKRLPSGTTAELYDVDFVNAETGWAVGEQGTVLSTVDGGRTWRSQRVGTRLLSSVDFVDAEYGWAVEDGGTVLATSDGGHTWSGQAMPHKPNLSRVVATDRMHAWLLGTGESGSIVLGTTDGATWSKLMTYQAGHWDYLADLTFTDQRHGWAVGSKGAILATDDGGLTWSRQRSGTSLQLSRVCFLDSRRGWVVGFAGEDMPRPIVLSTADGGMTWVRRSVGSRGTMVVDVAFSDATHGWAVAGYRRNLSAVSPDLVWVCLRTSDGGATWTAQEVTHQSLGAVDSWGSSLVWAVGGGGRVYGRRR
jgi:photosystem II stability/assembly factor-like uncharacterized protein